MNTINKKILLSMLISSLITSGASAVPVIFSDEIEYVIRVKDGDTFVAMAKDHGEIDVRLWGADAPELKQAGGLEATEHLKKLLRKHIRRSNIYLECKSTNNGRIVCTPLAEDKQGNITDITLELTKDGHAWDDNRFSRAYYGYYQQWATERKLGLWGAKETPIAPWEWRSRKKNRQAKKRKEASTSR